MRHRRNWRRWGRVCICGLRWPCIDRRFTEPRWGTGLGGVENAGPSAAGRNTWPDKATATADPYINRTRRWMR